MACNNVCRLCDRFIISRSVSFTDGNLIINLPADAYRNGERYCVVIAQAMPEDTTITAPVFITIGDGTTLYPFTNRCCAQLSACSLRTRTRYTVLVVTNATGGSFRMLGRPACSPDNSLKAIDGGASAAADGGNKA